jgi:hypothetical protein
MILNEEDWIKNIDSGFGDGLGEYTKPGLGKGCGSGFGNGNGKGAGKGSSFTIGGANSGIGYGSGNGGEIGCGLDICSGAQYDPHTVVLLRNVESCDFMENFLCE